MRVVLLAAMVPLELRSEVDSVCAHGGRAAFERVAGRGKRDKVVLEVGTD
jgi:hypothetical protein